MFIEYTDKKTSCNFSDKKIKRTTTQNIINQVFVNQLILQILIIKED